MIKIKPQRNLESAKKLKWASWISALASITILFIKFGAYWITHSSAILSDALEGIVNVMAALVAIVIMRMMLQPADAEHPYGHGKLEYFSSAFEGGMIVIAALLIIFESIQSYFRGFPLHQLDRGIYVVILGGLLNFVLALYLRKVGEQHKSDTLMASSAHIMSDFWTTVGLTLGLCAIWLTGKVWLDSVIAIFVGFHLCFAGYKIVRRSIAGLIDEVDKDVLEAIANAIEKNRRQGMIDIHALRVIRSGGFHHVDAHLVVPEYWEVSRVHDASNVFEQDTVKDYPFDGEIVFHLDPCRRSYCRICDVFDCPIRRDEFKNLRPFSINNITGGPQPTVETYDESNYDTKTQN